jgi:hypothetical protein
MIKLKSLIKEETLHKHDWRDLPKMMFWMDAISRHYKETKYTPASKEEERQFVEEFLRYNIRNFMKNSFLVDSADIEKEIVRISDEWFLEKYIRSKSTQRNEA